MNSWWLRLIKVARPDGRYLIAILLLTLIGAFLTALTPWPMKLLVDNVIGGEPLPDTIARFPTSILGNSKTMQVVSLSFSTILLYLVTQLIQLGNGYLSTGLGNQMIYTLGAHLFNHLQRLSLRFHGHKPTGDLVKRVLSDTSCVRDLILSIFIPITTSTANLVIMFVVMWQLHIPLTFVALLVVPIIFSLVRRFEGPMTEFSYAYEQSRAEVMSFSEQILTAMPVIQAFDRVDIESNKYQELFSQSNSSYLLSLRSKMHFSIGVNTATVFGTALIMIIGGFSVNSNGLTIGVLLIFLSYLAYLYGPLQELAYMSSGFASARARAMRVLEVLESKEMVSDMASERPDVADGQRHRGNVRLEGVTFGYELDTPILRDISLEAKTGETIALVGRTGAGKSTLVSIIPRLHDAWEGRVLIGEEDVLKLPLEYIRKQVAFVPQDPYLLPITIAENIAYGRIDATLDEIREAANLANADEFIRNLPQKYDTVIGEQGSTLSGGERQRISIARAFIKNAPILILDEPTSALDVETEALLIEALERVMEGRTTFIIAHRLSTIKNADKIIVLEEGRIVEEGNHEELYSDEGVYRQFFDLQFGHPAAGNELNELWSGDWH